MSLKVGDKAPDFCLLNSDGVEICLKDLLGKKIVLYFYPKDNTPGCTQQACDFSENFDKFSDKNAIIVGISPDSVKSHTKFSDKFKLKHILLSDEDKEVSKVYGVWGLKKNYGKEYEGIIRTTFIIDEKGKIIQIYQKVSVKEHALKVLESL
ncbi:thioredoxin-dependent thiol peroxidase [Campylobacter sp. LR291e]|uniref:thioredoxin-dependent thiol peroxidase n=1 Tax=unclassified Campylobacter TaxID=2593542 RepID=UPI00123B5227|nr:MULTISPECIES: thioredoxin-dependent thiol peroxidase [unclassified Campylobacter]KAA6231391.1 thioredoxin-dependent thiol peroxidase [Campylobacter sp. LR264d]KAA6231603.1 thioredoxin-dependent thiol peroxidase [Campylobacter sp. LR291e]